MKTLVSVAVIMLLLLYVWERVEVVRVGYHIERLKTQKTALHRERDELQVRFSTLTSPERVARVAKEQLGMAPPQPGQIILVKVEGSGPSGRTPQPTLQLAKRDTLGLTPGFAR
jgi:cell division protein FtsL